MPSNVRAICPFCNASVVSATPAARVVCTRCGESFAPTDWQPTEAEPEPAAMKPARSNRRFYLVACLSLALALGALAYFQPWASPPAPKAGESVKGTQPPRSLAGLKYLPSSANVVLSLQPAAMMAFQHVDRGNARELWACLGVPEPLAGALSAVSPDDVGEITIGATFFVPYKPYPAVTMYVHFLHDHCTYWLKQDLKMERRPQAGRIVYDTRYPLVVATMLDERTWLFGLGLEDLASADAPKGGALIEVISAIDPASFAWLTTGRRDWTGVSFLVPKAVDAKLSRVRGLTVSLGRDTGPVAKTVIDFDIPATAAEAKAWLESHGTESTVARSALTVSRNETPEATAKWLRSLATLALK